MHLPRNNFRDLRESNAVLVAERQIAEQIADGRDAALLERRRAMRPHAAQIFHRIVQLDRHHQVYSGTGNPVGALTRVRLDVSGAPSSFCEGGSLAFSNLYHRFACGIVSGVNWDSPGGGQNENPESFTHRICLPARHERRLLFHRISAGAAGDNAATAPATATPVPADQLANRCAPDVKPGPPNAPSWTSWGVNLANWRFQPAAEAGISAADVPHLKLKWAFGIPNVRIVRSQPALYGGRVYVSGNDGSVYSLDASTGCTFWATTTPKAVRSGMLVGKSGSVEAVFFGEADGVVYALDANTGTFLWSTRADTHPAATITGTPSYLDGRIYVPVSSGEEQARRRPGYECCTFRGSVVAMDAATGKILWQTLHGARHSVAARKNSRRPHDLRALRHGYLVLADHRHREKANLRWHGRQLFRAGHRDERRRRSPRSQNRQDSSGPRNSIRKTSTKWNAATPPAAGCEPPTVPNSISALRRFSSRCRSHKRVLLLGQKTGIIYAVDPDARGKLLWHKHAGVGGSARRSAVGPGDRRHERVRRSLGSWRSRDAAPIPRKAAASRRITLRTASCSGKLRRPAAEIGARAAPRSRKPSARFPAPSSPARSTATSAPTPPHDGKIIWDFDTAQSISTR